MPLQKIIDSVRSRIPWQVMKQILKHHSLEKGRGWEDTVPKLKQHALGSDKKSAELVEILTNAYKEHLVAGEKSIRIYVDNKGKLPQIAEGLKHYNIPETKFAKSFPFSLSEEELDSEDLGSYLVSNETYNSQIMLTLCTKRTIHERVSIPLEDALADTKNVFTDFTEIIGIKEYTKQFFDVVFLDPLTGRIEIRLDTGKNISADERSAGFRQIIRKFEEIASSVTGKAYELDHPVNLFPAIDRLYRSNDGRICELAFTTEEGSIKHEKMRRRSQCLRKETYHRAGTKAVDGQISAYRIAATWEHRQEATLITEPELLLPGNARMLSKENISLNEAFVSKCAGIGDYNFILSKLGALIDSDIKDAA